MKQGMEVDTLMHEIDSEVHKLTDTFSFILKYRELFRGTGLEFAQLKEYSPGEDDADRIDWKASMRSDDVYVKQYEEERDLTVVVLLDVSSSMLFGTQDKLKSEYAAVVAGALIRAGIEIGDDVAVGLFADELVHFLPPANSETQYYRALQHIAEDETYGGGCDMDSILRFILNNVEEQSYAFVISDFLGLSEDWVNSLKMLSGKLRDVVGIMVRDIRDEELPTGTGRFRLKDPFSDHTMVLNLDKIKDDYEDLAAEQVEEVRQAFRRSDTGFVHVYAHDPFVKPLIQEMQLRAAF